VKDRRVLEARATLTGEVGERLGFLALPTIGAVGWPDLRHDGQWPEPVLLRSNIAGGTEGPWHGATATLALTPHPQEDISVLGDIQAGPASAGWMGLTVLGALDA
jgi:hypothetical protein